MSCCELATVLLEPVVTRSEWEWIVGSGYGPEADLDPPGQRADNARVTTVLYDGATASRARARHVMRRRDAMGGTIARSRSASADRTPASNSAVSRLSLLPRFEFVVAGAPIPVSARSQRLVALLAVERKQLRRAYIAGTLWPEVGMDRACASLRSALWMIPTQLSRFILVDGQSIQLAPYLPVDYHTAEATARRLMDTESVAGALVEDSLLDADLLSEWSEDWILIEQERFRQLRLHALESLCEQLTARR